MKAELSAMALGPLFRSQEPRSQGLIFPDLVQSFYSTGNKDLGHEAISPNEPQMCLDLQSNICRYNTFPP